jgi:hypothetical protein
MAGLHMVIPRRLTREEQVILGSATLKALKILEEDGSMQATEKEQYMYLDGGAVHRAVLRRIVKGMAHPTIVK